MGKLKKRGASHPHDLLTRSFLMDVDLVADLLRNYLDAFFVSKLDLSTLKRESPESIDPGLSELVGDLRYSVRFKGSGQEVSVLIILEHQSSPERHMILRLIKYVLGAYDQHLAAAKGEQVTFPYPLAVVLHHGEKPWTHIPTMSELIETVPGVDSDILRLPVCLIDLATIPLDQLQGHPAVCALLDALQSASMGCLQERLGDIFHRFKGVERERRLKSWITALSNYYASVQGRSQDSINDLTEALSDLYSRRESKKMGLTIAEGWMLEGEARGVAKGKAEGKAVGIAEGKVEGKVEGKAEAIIAFLEARFGEVPVSLRKKINALRKSRQLEKALKLAATCESIKEFRKEIGGASPGR